MDPPEKTAESKGKGTARDEEEIKPKHTINSAADLAELFKKNKGFSTTKSDTPAGEAQADKWIYLQPVNFNLKHPVLKPTQESGPAGELVYTPYVVGAVGPHHNVYPNQVHLDATKYVKKFGLVDTVVAFNRRSLASGVTYYMTFGIHSAPLINISAPFAVYMDPGTSIEARRKFDQELVRYGKLAFEKIVEFAYYGRLKEWDEFAELGDRHQLFLKVLRNFDAMSRFLGIKGIKIWGVCRAQEAMHKLGVEDDVFQQTSLTALIERIDAEGILRTIVKE